ncbi:MAG TPA: hypothetical protein VJV23_01915, partial [Candidatus Polarisedimenticolia bacterium]|nr:hypothetical protein [Candidatus Polarisedimenticolia bacterium]
RAAGRSAALGRALQRLAHAQARSGESAAAARSLEQAEQVLRQAASGGEPDAAVHLALFLFAERRFEEAARLFGETADRLGRATAGSAEAAGSGQAEAWRRLREICRENRASSLYNMAVDALNRAQFSEVERHLEPVCASGPRWERACAALRPIAARREEAFLRTVAGHEAALAREPRSAPDLLALGDLHAQLGHDDKAMEYYRRLQAMQSDAPGLADRIAAVTDPGPLPELAREALTPGGRVRIVHHRASLGADLERAAKAAWLRVTTSLGEDSLRGELTVVVHPTRRVFRQMSGRRVGGLVKGYYSRGTIHLFETPSHTLVEWVSTLTHEMAHHAVERLSGASAPRWLSEGVARYVEGDAVLVDRAGVARAVKEGRVPPLEQLDEVMERGWNDPELYLDSRDVSLLVVEEIVRGLGPGGLARAIAGLAEPAPEGGLQGVERAAGRTLAALDAAWRARLPEAGAPPEEVRP